MMNDTAREMVSAYAKDNKVVYTGRKVACDCPTCPARDCGGSLALVFVARNNAEHSYCFACDTRREISNA